MTDTGWFPLALSASIEAGTSAGAVLEGNEIVVWRDTAGAAHAWEDRCPHRGMKLSFGFVRGDHIACLYHGWEYDAGGQCRYIPAHPTLEVPQTIRTRTHALAECGGMIFVHWPEGEGASPPPDLPAAEAVRSLYLDAPLATVADALADGFGASASLSAAPGVVRLETDLGTVLAGLQPVGPGRSAVHLAMPGASSSEARIALALRAEAFRRLVEARAEVAA